MKEKEAQYFYTIYVHHPQNFKSSLNYLNYSIHCKCCIDNCLANNDMKTRP